MNPDWRRNYQRYKAYLFHTMEQYRSRKDVRLYLELLLSLATIVLFSVFALRPTLLTIVDLFKQIDSKKETIILLDEKIANLEAARRLYSSQESNIQLLQGAIPDNSNPQQIVNQIEGLKSKHGFQLITMSIGGADVVGSTIKADESGKPSVSYSINSSAEYENLYRMLRDLERLRRPNVVDTLSFTRNITGDSITLVINANAIYSGSQTGPEPKQQ